MPSINTSKEGKLKEEKGNKQLKGKPGQQIWHESRIQAIRRKLSYTTVLQQCRRENKYTKHQRNIKQKMEKWYGRITADKIQEVQLNLKQELKAESEQFRKQKVLQQRRYVNRMFKIRPEESVLRNERK